MSADPRVPSPIIARAESGLAGGQHMRGGLYFVFAVSAIFSLMGLGLSAAWFAADPRFLLQKKIEGRLTHDHPTWWLPLYSQVTFSPDTPYHQALANGRRQEAIMARVMPLIQAPEDYDKPEVQEMIRREVGAKSHADVRDR